MSTRPSINTAHSAAPSILRIPNNKLLSALATEDRERLSAYLTVVPLIFKQILYKQGQPIRDVYFPGGGACSLVKMMEDGGTAEVATVGHEGIVGVSVYFGDDQSMGETIVQIGDASGFKMSVDAFRAEMDRRGAFHNLVIRYSQALTSQIIQTVACNALHQVERRCCRWLLIARDRVEHDDMKLTHEFMAIMLGVRRPTVSLVIGDLERLGLVSTHRGGINIVNRQGLEQRSCECYAVAKANFARLVPEIAGPVG